jgi:serine/threonine-protein kinase
LTATDNFFHHQDTLHLITGFDRDSKAYLSLKPTNMQCPSCQREIDPAHIFCGFCGEEVPKESGAAVSTDESLGSKLQSETHSEEAPVEVTEEETGDQSSYIGQIIDRRYQVLALVARGGMGTVFKVVHIHMRKVLAMKLLHEHMVERRHHVTRFMREARAISRLSNPHTVRIYDFGKYREVFYLAMEYLEGEDLFAVMEREGPLGISRTVTILDQICSSLQEAHRSGIIHRDLKSENVMIMRSKDGRDFVKVLDFGLAKVLDPDEPITAQSQRDLFGTPYYMAPEQIRGNTVDPRSDIYALGALTFRMLTATFPYAADTAFETLRLHLLEPVPSAAKRVPDLGIPKWLDSIVSRCLGKDPDDRFPDIRALREAFRSGPGTEFLGLEPLSSLPEDELQASPFKTHNPDGGERRKGFYDPNSELHELRSFRWRNLRKKALSFLAVVVLVGSASFSIWERLTRNADTRGRESEPNNIKLRANELPPGGSVLGTVGKRINHQHSDVDYYRLAVPDIGEQLLDVYLGPIPNMNLSVDVLSSKGLILAHVDREGRGEEERMSRIPVPGPFLYVRVQEGKRGVNEMPTENLSDSYRLWVRLHGVTVGSETEPNDTPHQAQELSMSSRVSGALDSPKDVDLYLVEHPGKKPTGFEIEVSDHLGIPISVRLLDNDQKERFRHTFAGKRHTERVRLVHARSFDGALFMEVSVSEERRATGNYQIAIRPLSQTQLKEALPNGANVLAYTSEWHGMVNKTKVKSSFEIHTSASKKEHSILKIRAYGRQAPRIRIVGLGTDSELPESQQILRMRKSSGPKQWEGVFRVDPYGEHLKLEILHSGGSRANNFEVSLTRRPDETAIPITR